MRWPKRWVGETNREYRYRCMFAYLVKNPGKTSQEVTAALQDVRRVNQMSVEADLRRLRVACQQDFGGDGRRLRD